MIDINKPFQFTDLIKRQNIIRANEYLHDKTLLQGHSYPLKILTWIYGEEYATDIIRPFKLKLLG